jgi:hypothetical protein
MSRTRQSIISGLLAHKADVGIVEDPHAVPSVGVNDARRVDTAQGTDWLDFLPPNRGLMRVNLLLPHRSALDVNMRATGRALPRAIAEVLANR